MKIYLQDGNLPLVGILTALSLAALGGLSKIVWPEPDPQAYQNIQLIEEQFGIKEACDLAQKIIVNHYEEKYIEAAEFFLRRNCGEKEYQL